MNTHQLYINGEFVDSASTTTLDVIDPSTTEVIGRVPDADAADVDSAVKADCADDVRLILSAAKRAGFELNERLGYAQAVRQFVH